MKKDKNKDIEKEILDVIERIKPYLEYEGGGIEFVRFEEGIVYVHLTGACEGCGLVDVTLKDGVEAMLMDEIPEVLGVEQA